MSTVVDRQARARTVRAGAGVGAALVGAVLVAGATPAPAATDTSDTTQGLAVKDDRR